MRCFVLDRRRGNVFAVRFSVNAEVVRSISFPSGGTTAIAGCRGRRRRCASSGISFAKGHVLVSVAEICVVLKRQNSPQAKAVSQQCVFVHCGDQLLHRMVDDIALKVLESELAADRGDQRPHVIQLVLGWERKLRGKDRVGKLIPWYNAPGVNSAGGIGCIPLRCQRTVVTTSMARLSTWQASRYDASACGQKS